MLDIASFIMLCIIAIVLYRYRYKPIPAPTIPFYFQEENELSLATGRYIGKLEFYTISEFCETQSILSSGVEKKLGFSRFPLIFDTNTKKIKDARVTFVGSNGYQRANAIGFYKPLNEEEDWLEITIHFTLDEFDSFFRKLKNHCEDEDSNGSKYFLFSLSTIDSIKTSGGALINAITAISEVGVYDEYYADKIAAMLALEEGLTDPDPKYRGICESFKSRFLELSAASHARR